MGSKSVSGWAASQPLADRIALVGSNEGNVDLMAEMLADHNLVTAATPDELDPVLSGTVDAGLAIVDTHSVSDDVTALVGALRERDVPVLLLANDAPSEVRERAAATDGIAYRDKPVRADDLRAFAVDALE